jgi:hypothetical protein
MVFAELDGWKMFFIITKDYKVAKKYLKFLVKGLKQEKIRKN